MNQNDMDRYYWRTGLCWSADDRANRRRIGLVGRTMLLVAVSFVITEIALFFVR